LPLLIIQLLQYQVVAESLVRKRDGKGDNVIVTYHDSSQAINCLGLHPEARHITQGTLGLELREMPQSDVCCGFGSSTSIEHGDVAERIMNNKLNNAASTEAMVLVADNPGCLMHLRGGVDAIGRKKRALHLVLVCGAKWPLERLHSKQEVLFW
jgi:L-lactate dehydrogenase complex protein LldF